LDPSDEQQVGKFVKNPINSCDDANYYENFGKNLIFFNTDVLLCDSIKTKISRIRKNSTVMKM